MRLINILSGLSISILIVCGCAEKSAEMYTNHESSSSSSQTENKEADVSNDVVSSNDGTTMAMSSLAGSGNKKNSNAFISSSAAIEKNKDSTRKFIRTAELRFRVQNVIQSTYSIEETAKRFGGFIAYTNLSSTINNVYSTEISADSSLETTNYTVENNIVLRVPNTKLDTTLKTIALTIDFLDYRIIKADDVALQLLSNELAQKRSAKNGKRLTDAIDAQGNKLIETTIAEDAVFSKQEQADNAKIANLSLKDQIDFSTINVTIYQRKTSKHELIANEKNIKAYEPGFGYKLIEAIKSGWYLLESIVLALFHLWALILIAVGIFILYRMVKLRNKI